MIFSINLSKNGSGLNLEDFYYENTEKDIWELFIGERYLLYCKAFLSYFTLWKGMKKFVACDVHAKMLSS